VQFFPGCGNNGNFLPADHPGAVPVTDGKVTAGVDGVLPVGGAISGSVTDSHGTPLAGICVSASSNNNGGFSQTAADGSYSLTQLTTGRYTVGFAGGCGNARSVAPQSYNDVTTGDGVGADEIPVTQGVTTSGINAAMQPGGTVTGLVTSSSGKRLGGACVTATPVGNTLFGGGAGVILGLGGAGFGLGFAVSRHGGYKMANLSPGQYAVDFSTGCGVRGNLAQQFFKGQDGFASADGVSVSPGRTTAGIDGVLRPAGAIAGVVRGTSNRRLPFFCVLATSTAGGADAPQSATFGFSGKYRLTGLLPGAYHVEFVSGCGPGNYASQWYKAKSTAASADRVAVRAGHTTSPISADLTRGGSIRVRSASGPAATRSGTCASSHSTHRRRTSASTGDSPAGPGCTGSLA
jgi:hypothetical protein